MRPCENVIVTLAAGETALDMELPAFLPFAELTPKIAETLAVMEPRRFGGASLELSFGGSRWRRKNALRHTASGTAVSSSAP